MKDAYDRLQSEVGLPDRQELMRAWSIVAERHRASSSEGCERSLLQGSLFLLEGLIREGLGPRLEASAEQVPMRTG